MPLSTLTFLITQCHFFNNQWTIKLPDQQRCWGRSTAGLPTAFPTLSWMGKEGTGTPKCKVSEEKQNTRGAIPLHSPHTSTTSLKFWDSQATHRPSVSTCHSLGFTSPSKDV
ncbi:hypothetical protein E2C01_006854 [Portunus trituberculatus]|uniref:Uncharacterized protein n=1 Tax=Portunus trituberculatus TaxID=210409 RepID=A0A5B7CYX9_PORTR|nr:hypothetical protein [Portunus trituberculatus]